MSTTPDHRPGRQPQRRQVDHFQRPHRLRQHVGNWPGKTVEKKEGVYRHNGAAGKGAGNRDVRIVDLPGAYSLTAYSAEEIITRDYILEEKPGWSSTSSTPPT